MYCCKRSLIYKQYVLPKKKGVPGGLEDHPLTLPCLRTDAILHPFLLLRPCPTTFAGTPRGARAQGMLAQLPHHVCTVPRQGCIRPPPARRTQVGRSPPVRSPSLSRAPPDAGATPWTGQGQRRPASRYGEPGNQSIHQSRAAADLKPPIDRVLRAASSSAAPLAALACQGQQMSWHLTNW